MVYRHDRQYSQVGLTRGGGVLLAVKKDIPSILLQEGLGDHFGFESLLVKVSFPRHSSVCIGVVYFPPSSGRETYWSFYDSAQTLIRDSKCKLLFVGDFNIPYYGLPNSHNNPICDDLDVFCENFELYSLNKVKNKSGRTLDLVLSSEEGTTVYEDDSILQQPDGFHPPLHIQLPINFPKVLTKASNISSGMFKNFNNINYIELFQTLSTQNWDTILSTNNPDIAAETFDSTFNSILQQFVPTHSKKARKYPSWFSKEAIRKIKEKENFRRKFKKSGLVCHQLKYQLLRKESKELILASKKSYDKLIEERLSTNPRQFWSFIKEKKGPGPSSSTYKLGESILTDPTIIANTFATTFANNFSIPLNNARASPHNSMTNVISVDNTCSKDIINTLRKMPPKRCVGPDGVPLFVYKRCAVFLVKPLLHIFNLILSTSTFPKIWKVSKVVPIPKSKELNNIALHRPVTIIPSISKIFETILCERILDQVRHMITPKQHGFFPGRSITTNLSTFVDDIAGHIDIGAQTDVVYTDFQKAFDKVDHGILISKLESYGFSATLTSLLKSYLTDRIQKVFFKGVM